MPLVTTDARVDDKLHLYFAWAPSWTAIWSPGTYSNRMAHLPIAWHACNSHGTPLLGAKELDISHALGLSPQIGCMLSKLAHMGISQ
jgi:hypothetical protein